MKNIYSISYDIRIGRDWLGGHQPWANRNVLANGDAREAIKRLEKEVIAEEFDGKRVKAMRVIEVTKIAADILV